MAVFSGHTCRWLFKNSIVSVFHIRLKWSHKNFKACYDQLNHYPAHLNKTTINTSTYILVSSVLNTIFTIVNRFPNSFIFLPYSNFSISKDLA